MSRYSTRSTHHLGNNSPNSQQLNMDNVTETALTESFDKLVSEGVIVYGPNESIKLDHEGYPVS